MKISLDELAKQHGAVQEAIGNNIAWLELQRRKAVETNEAMSDLARSTMGNEKIKPKINQPQDIGISLEEAKNRINAMNAMTAIINQNVQSISSGLGNAVSQWLVYGQSFRDSMIGFFRQWAAQSIAYIIQVETEMLILRSLGFAGIIGAGSTTGSPSGGTTGPSVNVPGADTGGFVSESGLAVIHKGERILTKDEASSGGVTVVKQKIQFIIPAMDGASVERVLRSQAGTIQDIIGKSVRRNRTFARELS
jgi:hypothetical protein